MSTIINSERYIPLTARPQILSNGWILSGMNNSNNPYHPEFYVSKDNGATFELLTIWSAPCSKGFSVCSYGTTVCCIGVGVSDTFLKFVSFDATTVGSTVATSLNIDSSQTMGNDCCLAINATGTAMTAVWRSTNIMYPNSINLRSAKSIDGGATWIKQDGTAGKDQLTTYNLVGTYSSAPYVVYSSIDTPVICHRRYVGDTTISIGIEYFTTYWQSSYINDSSGVFISTMYTKKRGSNIGRIFASTPNAVVYSDNYGDTWAGCFNAPSATTDLVFSETLTGDIIVIWRLGATVIYKLCPNGSISFGSEIDTLNVGSYVNLSDLGNNRIVYTYKNASGSPVLMKFDSLFIYNSPPLPPTGLTRSNFDKTANANFTWTFNDSDIGDKQSAYQIQIIKVSDGSTVLNTGKVISSTSSYTLPLNTLVNNTQYQWKVNTWDAADLVGTYSSLATFWCYAIPIVEITYPAVDNDINGTTKLTVQWTYSDPQDLPQVKYQIQLLSAVNAVLFDTGEVLSAIVRSYTIDYNLTNGVNYKIKLTAWSNGGIDSNTITRLFNESYTPPAIPVLTYVVDNIRGSIALTIVNPVPVGSQPIVLHNDVYRLCGTIWSRIATNISVSYTDFTPASGTIYQYKVIAIGANETTINSNIIAVTTTFRNAQLSLITDYTKFINLVLNPSRSKTIQLERSQMSFAGRVDPVSEYGEHVSVDKELSFTIISANELVMLESLLYSRQILLYRDSRGQRIFGTVESLKINDDIPRPHWTVSFTINKTSYSEVV